MFFFYKQLSDLFPTKHHLLRGRTRPTLRTTHRTNFWKLNSYFSLYRTPSNFCKLTREFGKLMLENRMHPNGVEDDALCKIILNLAPKFSSIKCVSSLKEGSSPFNFSSTVALKIERL